MSLERQEYLATRAANPTARAADVWAYVNCGERWLTFKQFMCRHEWSSGYDESDHEIGVYCLLCGANGDV